MRVIPANSLVEQAMQELWPSNQHTSNTRMSIHLEKTINNACLGAGGVVIKKSPQNSQSFGSGQDGLTASLERSQAIQTS